jgi:hypothetical protein
MSVEEVFENQRWLIGAWTAPIALLDQAAWTSIDGNAVSLDTLSPSLNDQDRVPCLGEEWDVVIDHSTDPEGWQYGTVFNHLDHKRPGGRASQRLGDMVRRRKWKRKSGKDHGRKSAVHQRLAEEVFQATHASESRAKALRTFTKLILDVVSKKKFWEMIPWDPGSFYVIQRKHSEEYAAMRDRAVGINMNERGTLLQDLICGAAHSRAAYGFAMQAGHIKNVSSYIKLHTLQPLRFDPIGGVSQEANNEAISELTGIAVENILQSNWRNSPFRPCYYVAADLANQSIVISIRGSLELGDLLSDVTANSVKVSLLGSQGWVHEGMMASATYIHCCTKSILERSSDAYPGWPILITGHSLGGGVAAVLAMLLLNEGGVTGLGDIRCITIGSAAVMSESLSQVCDSFSTSVILGSDPIPHLSHASLEKLLLEMSAASPMKRAAEDFSKNITRLWSVNTEATASENVETKTIEVITLGDDGHKQKEKPLHIDTAAQDKDSPEIMYPPGKLLWILCKEGAVSMEAVNSIWEKEWTQTGEISQDDEGVSVVLEVDRNAFGRILVLPSMLDDHIPDNYLNALKSL